MTKWSDMRFKQNDLVTCSEHRLLDREFYRHRAIYADGVWTVTIDYPNDSVRISSKEVGIIVAKPNPNDLWYVVLWGENVIWMVEYDFVPWTQEHSQ